MYCPHGVVKLPWHDCEIRSFLRSGTAQARFYPIMMSNLSVVGSPYTTLKQTLGSIRGAFRTLAARDRACPDIEAVVALDHDTFPQKTATVSWPSFPCSNLLNLTGLSAAYLGWRAVLRFRCMFILLRSTHLFSYLRKKAILFF